jgi:hypothetical protein
MTISLVGVISPSSRDRGGKELVMGGKFGLEGSDEY